MISPLIFIKLFICENTFSYIELAMIIFTQSWFNFIVLELALLSQKLLISIIRFHLLHSSTFKVN